MPEYIKIVNKKRGQTPLECINELKKDNEKLKYLPMTYAGRLDPLASGVLVILTGDECQKKDEYLKLPKEYEVTVLFGFATDTYDVMGLVEKTKESFDFSWSGPLSSLVRGPEKLNDSEVFDNKKKEDSFALEIQKILPKFTGRIKQSYPPYSSRTVNGKPLYQWAREGKLDEIEIPSHDVFVEKIEIIKEDFISGEKLFNKIEKDISLVKGDFRQKEIISVWREALSNKREEKYKTITLRISCGSGVYVRGIAYELGVSMMVPTLALNIKRTKVGEFQIPRITKLFF